MILVVNAGSSSVKVELFSTDLTSVIAGSVTEIGGAGELRLGTVRRAVSAPDHDAALMALLDALAQAGHPFERITAAGHRVVHGGTDLTRPVRLTPAAIGAIRDCIPLAPLHNPHHLAGILALAQRAPDLPQCASFDTAFHATNPAVATTYALPPDLTAQGYRRYGFHGISYASLVAALPQRTGQPLPQRLLACHLGNGVSLCAIRDGRSVATTMGYSPLEGLTMGTRSGSIDANAVLAMAAAFGIDETGVLLNNRSGLLGLSGGTSDMRALLASDAPAARFAVDHFVYWACRHAGSMIAAMGGVDAVAFTGGIGEHAAAIRDRIMDGLAWAGPVPHHIVPADEERQIAADTQRLLEEG
ncbi:acetate/propionate family kinase [Thalassococcus sp. BH17M4-6]|uniref:acetate/propionate family kinase n=1 Tax=Thalassococcus sp. BH17M4-6 TaxID=3413148 RepID=UPI003BE770EF